MRVVLVLLYDRNEHVFETVQSSEVLENLMNTKGQGDKVEHFTLGHFHKFMLAAGHHFIVWQ